MSSTLQRNSDTAATWTGLDYVLAEGEVGVETDTLRFKIGDGTTAWTALAYAVPTSFGSVTSVAVSGSDGIEVDSGSPVTTSGTIALGLSATVLGQLSDAASAVQPGDLAAVATTGDYNDLINLPSIPSGTVTSVAVSGSDGIEVDSGSPVTSSGTIALGLSATVLGQLTDASTAVQPGDLGTAAAEDIGFFATAAQGGLADTAVQPGDNISTLTNDAGYITSAPVTSVNGDTGVVVLDAGDVGAEPAFTKGDLVQGTNVTLTGTLTDRLVGSGDVTIDVAGSSPGGSTGEVQFNDGGVFEGAARVLIDDDDLVLGTSTTPTMPSAGTVKLFGRDVSGRVMPAFAGPSGLDSVLQPFLGRNKVAWFNPPGNATTVQTLGINMTATGTATAASVAITNIHTAMRRLEYAVTTASATAVAGLRGASAQYHIGDSVTPYGGFTAVLRFGPSRGVASNATRRFFAGMSSLTSAPTDAEPSTSQTNAIGVCADAADTNFHIVHRTGSSGATKIDTGIPKAYSDNTEMFELTLFTAPTGSPSVGYRFIRLSDNTAFSGTITTNLPAVTQLLAPRMWTSVGGTSSVVGLAVASVYIETDY